MCAYKRSRYSPVFKSGGGLVLHPTIEQMAEAQPGMLAHHSRPRVAHHLFDLLTPVALITMDRAFRAGRLFLAKTAMVQAQTDMAAQILAVSA